MGLQEDLKEIKEKLSKNDAEQSSFKKLPKPFKIPFTKRVRPKQAAQNYVTVIKVNENGFIDFKKEKIVEQTIIVDGIPRLAMPEYVLHYKSNPVVIQPSWSVKPYSPSEAAQASLDDGSNIKGYKILMARMKSDTIGNKTQMGNMGKWIIGLALAAIVGYALLTGGG